MRTRTSLTSLTSLPNLVLLLATCLAISILLYW